MPRTQDASKRTFETWLDRKYPNAEDILRAVRSAGILGRPALGARPQIAAIENLILDHARRDFPYRILFNRGQLKARVPDLSEQDISVAARVATRAALGAANDVLSGKTTFSEASHASQIRTAMRRAMREVARQYRIETSAQLKAHTVTEVDEERRLSHKDIAIPLAGNGGKKSPTTNDSDDYDPFGDAAHLRGRAGSELVGVIEGGHSVSTVHAFPDASRPYWRDRPSSVLCLQCHGPRPTVEEWEQVSTPTGVEVSITRDLEPGFSFCSLACEHAFFSGSSPVDELADSESRAFGRLIVAASRPGQDYGTAIAGGRQATALLDRRVLGLTRRAIEKVRRQTNHALTRTRERAKWRASGRSLGPGVDTVRPDIFAEEVAARVLNSDDFEIWRHRNDDQESTAKHRLDLKLDGRYLTPNNYRQRRFVAKKKVDQALAEIAARSGRGLTAFGAVPALDE